jgi:glycosyltransferase involved in cell wall biosynthesis
MKKLTVLIPCYNEEKGVSKVIQSIPKEKLNALGYATDILVIDNNSKDKTSEVAKNAGARVLLEKKQGKGYAVRKGFKAIKDSNIVVMIDGDNTYKASEMLRLVEPIDNGFCDVVLGSRLSGNIAEGSMPYFNRMGNWLFTFLVRVGYHGNVTDVCTGYFAWKGSKLKELSKYVESNGFSLEMEMVTKMAKMKFNIISVPITYKKRSGETHLSPIGDGKKIIHAWMRNLFWNPYAHSEAK